ncbi:hypothetical protein [Fervidicella metallireducens]|uniref:hypothetical protein n=1 Tax=Fervidicella metallireducens TaxID=655338 RepID=UPI00054EEB41|nr:hypothetical protein [Fervidicella metallireducens]
MDFMLFEDIINRIDGVLNSKVITEQDTIAEIHILASNHRSAKQIVRDIESSILASYNYRIDRKKISVAQIQTDFKEAFYRIKFSGVSLKSLDNTVECTLKLNYKDEDFYVTQVGINTAANRRKIVADCTVKAVEKILGQAFIFDIHDVVIGTSSDITYVTVLVNMILNNVEETMVGSAVIKNDVNETIAKATLDAINRRVQKVNI